MQAETNDIKETINSINDVIDPIRQEFESDSDDIVLHERNDYLDDLEMVRYTINKTIYKIILLFDIILDELFLPVFKNS